MEMLSRVNQTLWIYVIVHCIAHYTCFSCVWCLTCQEPYLVEIGNLDCTTAYVHVEQYITFSKGQGSVGFALPTLFM